jgi:hypothetical protein
MIEPDVSKLQEGIEGPTSLEQVSNPVVKSPTAPAADMPAEEAYQHAPDVKGDPSIKLEAANEVAEANAPAITGREESPTDETLVKRLRELLVEVDMSVTTGKGWLSDFLFPCFTIACRP